MVTINLKRYEATCKGEVIPLTISEYYVLLLLANEMPNTTEELIEWLEYHNKNVDWIRHVVCRLRKKLIKARAFDIDIVCRREIGYQLYGDIYIDY